MESRWGRDFPHPSRPALGPTQPPTQWVPGLSRGVKRPGRGVDHQPPSSAEVKERVELYFFSPFGPSWPVLGWTSSLPFKCNILRWEVPHKFNKMKVHIHAPYLNTWLQRTTSVARGVNKTNQNTRNEITGFCCGVGEVFDWDVVERRFVVGYQSFRTAFRPHLQGSKRWNRYVVPKRR